MRRSLNPHGGSGQGRCGLPPQAPVSRESGQDRRRSASVSGRGEEPGRGLQQGPPEAHRGEAGGI